MITTKCATDIRYLSPFSEFHAKAPANKVCNVLVKITKLGATSGVTGSVISMVGLTVTNQYRNGIYKLIISYLREVTECYG